MKRLLITFNFCLFTFSSFLLPFPFLFAQWSTSPDSALQIGVGDETYIISDGNGGAFVLFDGDGWVRLQKIDRYGYVQWNNITPQGGIAVGGNPADTCLQEVANEHSLVLDDQGGVYVSFHDFCFTSPYTTVSTVRLQHLDRLGNLLWGADGMPVSARNSYQTSLGAIVTDGAGGIIVLYNEKDSVNAPTKLYSQRFDAAGNRLWGNEGIVVKEPGGFRDVESDGAGGVVINYMSQVNNSSVLQRINQNGQILWGSNGAIVPSGAFEIEVDPVGEAVYVHNSGGKLRLNKVSLIDGSLLWDSLGVAVDTLGVNERVKGFDWIPNHGVGITWNEEVSAGNWDVFVQWLTPNGNFLYDVGGITASTFFSSKNALGLLSSTKIDTSVIVYWGDSRGGLYAQRLNHVGERLWGQEDIAITSFGTIGSEITSDSNGGLIISFAKFYDFIVSAQQLSFNGNLGEVLPISINRKSDSIFANYFKLYSNYPNPFNPITTISFYLPGYSNVELTIYNNLGEEIITLVSGKRRAGEHEIEWDGTNDSGRKVASGIYYYRLKVDNRIQTRKMLLVR